MNVVIPAKIFQDDATHLLRRWLGNSRKTVFFVSGITPDRTINFGCLLDQQFCIHSVDDRGFFVAAYLCDESSTKGSLTTCFARAFQNVTARVADHVSRVESMVSYLHLALECRYLTSNLELNAGFAGAAQFTVLTNWINVCLNFMLQCELIGGAMEDATQVDSRSIDKLFANIHPAIYRAYRCDAASLTLAASFYGVDKFMAFYLFGAVNHLALDNLKGEDSLDLASLVWANSTPSDLGTVVVMQSKKFQHLLRVMAVLRSLPVASYVSTPVTFPTAAAFRQKLFEVMRLPRISTGGARPFVATSVVTHFIKDECTRSQARFCPGMLDALTAHYMPKDIRVVDALPKFTRTPSAGVAPRFAPAAISWTPSAGVARRFALAPIARDGATMDVSFIAPKTPAVYSAFKFPGKRARE